MNGRIIYSRREALKLLGGLYAWHRVGAGRGLAAEAVMAGGASPEAEPATLLFFDDEFLFSRDGVERRLGSPERVGSYWESAGNCTWGRPAVFRTPDGPWRMVYQAGVGRPDRGGGITLLAESDDGLDWRPYNTTESLNLEDRAAPHQILPTEMGSLGSAFEDVRAPADERYKLLSVQETEDTAVWCSPDLVNWRLLPGAKWHPRPPDPPAFVFWNAKVGKYIITTRPEWPDRRLALVETGNWREFTEPRLVLHADADDRPLAQLYGMYVKPYAGYYVGFAWVFYAGSATDRRPPHRYRGGRVETYLCYSLDGLYWQRCKHEPLFRNGTAGAVDAGCLQVSNLIQLENGSLRAYAACSRSEHGICPADDGYITAYALRRDGFVCLASGGETGNVCTKALYWRGGEASLNVAASGGVVQVRVREARGKTIPGYEFENSEPFTGDDVAWVPRWKSGRTLDALSGRMIMLEIRMVNARLYAIRGNFTLVRLLGLQRWEKEGIAPSPGAGL